MADMDGRGCHQPHIAVNPPARVPARRSRRIIEPEDKHVVLPRLGIGRQVNAPGFVTVRPAADKLPVQPDGRVSHRPVHIQEDGFAGVRFRQIEILPIPPNPVIRQFARPAVAIPDEGSFDGPIMRQIQALPPTVVKPGLDVSHLPAQIPIGPGMPLRGVLQKIIARGQDPLLDDLRRGIGWRLCRRPAAPSPSAPPRPHIVEQTELVGGRIALCEPPVHVQREAFPRRDRPGGRSAGGIAGAAILVGENENRSKNRSGQDETGLVAANKLAMRV